MTWQKWCNALMRYYSGLNHLNIPKMTVWQFVQSIKNMGWLESQAGKEQEDTTSARAALGNTGEVPTLAQIRAMARQINPDLKIPKG